MAINITREQAVEIFEDRSNGRLDGISPSKGGRAWLDGEFSLDELEALCVMVRFEAGEDAQGAEELADYYRTNAGKLGLNPADWIRPGVEPDCGVDAQDAENHAAELLAENEQLHDIVEELLYEIRALMETGRDRIMELGGKCDDVDTMFRHNPKLQRARALTNFQH